MISETPTLPLSVKSNQYGAFPSKTYYYIVDANGLIFHQDKKWRSKCLIEITKYAYHTESSALISLEHLNERFAPIKEMKKFSVTYETALSTQSFVMQAETPDEAKSILKKTGLFILKFNQVHNYKGIIRDPNEFVLRRPGRPATITREANRKQSYSVSITPEQYATLTTTYGSLTNALKTLIK